MTDFIKMTCWKCKVEYGMTPEFYRVAKLMASNTTFYCPNGHGAEFQLGESDEDKLRRERDQLQQRIAQKDDEIRAAWASANQQAEFVKAGERKLAAAKGQITKIKKRASNGVCPCCNRTFSDLARHMHSKHPGFVQEPTADEHVH